MLILDIACQHLGDECELEGFCVPCGHRVGEIHIFRNIYLYWIYDANNLASMLQVYVDIGYIMPKVWG